MQVVCQVCGRPVDMVIRTKLVMDALTTRGTLRTGTPVTICWDCNSAQWKFSDREYIARKYPGLAR